MMIYWFYSLNSVTIMLYPFPHYRLFSFPCILRSFRNGLVKQFSCRSQNLTAVLRQPVEPQISSALNQCLFNKILDWRNRSSSLGYFEKSTMAAVNVVKDPPTVHKPAHVPPLQEVVEVLSKGLTSNFTTVDVSVVECPDLTEKPFTLACKGLGGKPRLIDLGGPPYLLPLVQRDKVYDMKDLCTKVDVKPAFMVGAGAGPWPFAGTNCEMMVNLEVKENGVNNQTRISKVNTKEKGCILEQLPDSETRCALLANLYVCEGKPGKVIKVHCKKRTGKDDFIASIRKTLQSHYGDKPIALGGTFLLKQGKAKQHVMPDFSKEPLHTEEQLNQWLQFYNMSAPLIAVGTLVSADPGLDLRVQHFHSFSHHGEGGHYHIDTEPETAEYLGYFNVADFIYRIDQPAETHQVGRD